MGENYACLSRVWFDKMLRLVLFSFLFFFFISIGFAVYPTIKKFDAPEGLVGTGPSASTAFLITTETREPIVITHDRDNNICVFKWDSSNLTVTPLRCHFVSDFGFSSFRGGEILSKPDKGILFMIGANPLQIKAIRFKSNNTFEDAGTLSTSIGSDTGYQGDIDKNGNLYFIGTNQFAYVYNINYTQTNVLSSANVFIKSYYCGEKTFVGVMENLTVVLTCRRDSSFKFFRFTGSDFTQVGSVSYGSFSGGFVLSSCNFVDTVDGFLDSVILTCRANAATDGVYWFNFKNMVVTRLTADCPERARVLPDGYVYYARWNGCFNPLDNDIYKILFRVAEFTEETPEELLPVKTKVFYSLPSEKYTLCPESPGTNIFSLLGYSFCGISLWLTDNIGATIIMSLIVVAFVSFLTYLFKSKK